MQLIRTVKKISCGATKREEGAGRGGLCLKICENGMDEAHVRVGYRFSGGLKSV